MMSSAATGPSGAGSRPVHGHESAAAGRGAGRAYRLLCGIEGSYFLATGVWPLLSIETFQMVTGRKTDHLVTGLEADHWLVMTVGVLVSAIGASLLVGAWRGRMLWEVAVLALGSSVGLAAIDIIYVARDVLLPIYLVDAVLQGGFITAWAILLYWQRPAWDGGGGDDGSVS